MTAIEYFLYFYLAVLVLKNTHLVFYYRSWIFCGSSNFFYPSSSCLLEWPQHKDAHPTVEFDSHPKVKNAVLQAAEVVDRRTGHKWWAECTRASFPGDSTVDRSGEEMLQETMSSSERIYGSSILSFAIPNCNISF